MLKILALAAILYLSYCGFMFAFQRQVLFPRQYAIQIPDKAEKIRGLQKIWLELSFGKVESWFLPPLSNEKKGPVLIFAHGNAELIEHWPEFFLPLTQSGIGVYLVEYPGYGRSEGIPSEKTIVETFVTAYDYIIKNPDVDPARVVFFGRSIGGGAVCALAEKRKPAAIILMSTFTGVSRMAKKYAVPGFLIRDPFDNLKTVESYGGPLLVIHGKHDEIIPYSHGVSLFQAAGQGQLVTYECGHNDCPPNLEEFYKDILKFLKKSGVQSGNYN